MNIDQEELGKVPQSAVDPEHFLLILWAFVPHSLCCPLFVRFISCLSCSTGLLLCPSFLPVLLFFGLFCSSSLFSSVFNLISPNSFSSLAAEFFCWDHSGCTVLWPGLGVELWLFGLKPLVTWHLISTFSSCTTLTSESHLFPGPYFLAFAPSSWFIWGFGKHWLQACDYCPD